MVTFMDNLNPMVRSLCFRETESVSLGLVSKNNNTSKLTEVFEVPGSLFCSLRVGMRKKCSCDFPNCRSQKPIMQNKKPPTKSLSFLGRPSIGRGVFPFSGVKFGRFRGATPVENSGRCQLRVSAAAENDLQLLLESLPRRGSRRPPEMEIFL